MKKKSHKTAFILSFLLAGTGLWYLGKWKWGFINLFAVLARGIILHFSLPEEAFFKIIRWVAIGCAGGSGDLAQAIAQQMSVKLKAQESASNSMYPYSSTGSSSPGGSGSDRVVDLINRGGKDVLGKNKK
ncbi:MAG: hypothetical protein ACMUJM_07955 [bacterium]